VSHDVFNDYIMDNYMFRPVLAIVRLSFGNFRSYYRHARTRGVEISLEKWYVVKHNCVT